MNSYHQWLVKKPSDVSGLEMISVPLRPPAAAEVRIKVQAAGLAFADIVRLKGKLPGTRFPFLPGYDCVGTIDAMGEQVTGYSLGQMVAALPMTGGHAEYAYVSAENIFALPASVSDATTVAATLLNYVSAYQMLYRLAHIQRGAQILVHGAAGGVGTAFLQLAALNNITVYGTASTNKHPVVAQFGGIPIDYRTESFVARVRELTQSQGVDAAFDPVGGMNLWRSYQTVKPGGKLIAYGMISAIENPLNIPLTFGVMAVSTLRGKSARLYGFSPQNDGFTEDVKRILNLLADQALHPVIAECIPFSQAPRAYGLLERSAAAGKIVLTM